MESNLKIQNFLKEIQNKSNRALLIQLTYSVSTCLISGLLASGFYFYFNISHPLLSYSLSGLILILLGWSLFSIKSISRITQDQAAILADARYPELKNSVINASQLGRHLFSNQETKPNFSASLIQEHIERTQAAIQNIDPNSIIRKQKLIPSRNAFLISFMTLLVTTFVFPNFWASSFSVSMSPQVAQEPSRSDEKKQTSTQKPLDYKVSNLSLTLEYPEYTQLKRKIIAPSDGSINALPGTEVTIHGNSNHPIEGAELVINNGDQFLIELKNSVDITGSLILREKGHYQFQVQHSSKKKIILKKKYPILLERDHTPQIILFPSNPKPVFYETDTVQMFYEAHDDFGIQEINLVAQINKTTLKKTIRHFKRSEKDSTGSFAWKLALENLQPGDEVQYFLEAKDNNNVSGSSSGQSEIYHFTIFDSREERENLVKLQEELSEKMIALLANGLIEGDTLKTTTTDSLYGKNLLASHADALIEIISLALRIKEQTKIFDTFPQSYLNLLNNIIKKATHIREEQIDAINKIQKTLLRPTPASYNMDSVEILNTKMVNHLEQSILYLIKMTNRQKMAQVMDLENQLSQLTENLQEEFEKFQEKKLPLPSKQIQEKLNQVQKVLQKMMDKLSQQNQSVQDEFLNSRAYKSMGMESTMASLEKIKDLANQGKMDEAMKELKKVIENLKTLASKLDLANSSMDSMLDNQAMEQINESMMKLEILERKQKEVLDKTSKINQKLRTKQTEQFQNLIKNFFEELKKDVKDIQDILNEDTKYLDKHRAMIRTKELERKEAELMQKLETLGQKTVDSSLDESLSDNFKALNRVQSELSDVITEKDDLGTQAYQSYKSNLHQTKKKYETLKKLAELKDLIEFNVLFKSTYPEIFRLQGNVRSSRNQRDDISNKLTQDLIEITRLNAEISKKLGSLKRKIENKNQSLLGKQDRSQLNKLAEKEKEMRQQSKEMKDLFNKMNRKNPLLPPSLSKNMSNAERNLQNAENRLKSQKVQRSLDSENKALKSIQDTKNKLNALKNSGSQMSNQGKKQTTLRLGTGSRRDSRRGGSTRMQKEKVELPSEDQYKVPREFREEILDAMKKQTPKNYERLVNEYYKELVK